MRGSTASSLIMNGDHVTLGEADAEVELDVRFENKSAGKSGTGCVHTAPGHGADDFHIGKAYGLEIYCPVDNAGRFTSEVEHFAGENVFEANPKIVEFLRESGALLFSRKLPASLSALLALQKSGHISRDAAVVHFDGRGRSANRRAERPATAERCDERSQRSNGIRRGARAGWGICSKGGRTGAFRGSGSWGVPIPVFYCQACDEAVADPKIIDHVADIFADETADAWYARRRANCCRKVTNARNATSADFRKETDILDVWFDSGSSCVAVLETRGDTLRFPADVYLEGGDQYRGWFNSSLICGIAAHDMAPYKQIMTHGWVVDGEGKKQSEIARQRDRSAGDHRQIGCGRSASLGGGGRLYRRCTLFRRDLVSRRRCLSQIPQHAAVRAWQSRWI